MLSNELLNTVGVFLIHKPIIWFTLSGRRITSFACLVDSRSSQAVKFSSAIIRCYRVHIQNVTDRAIKMGDISPLPATDTLWAFSFRCTVHLHTYCTCFHTLYDEEKKFVYIHMYVYICICMYIYIYVYLYIYIVFELPKLLSPLVGGWWGQGIARVSHVVRWKKYIYIVTVHKYLSQDGSLFYVRVTSGQSGTWLLAK